MRDNTGPLIELENLDKGCLVATARPPDNYNAQRASSLHVRETSKKNRMSALDAGEKFALKKAGSYRVGIQRKHFALDRGTIGRPQSSRS